MSPSPDAQYPTVDYVGRIGFSNPRENARTQGEQGFSDPEDE